MDQKRITDHEALLELGWSAIDTGDYEKAFTLSRLILESDLDCPEAHNLHGNVLAIMGHHGKAIEAFDKALKVKPDYAEAYYFRGLSHQELKAYKEATRDYTKAIRTGFDVAEVYNARGSAHAYCGNYPSAIRDFSKAIKLKPDFAMAWFNRGFTHTQHDQDSIHAVADIIHAAKLGYKPAIVLLNKLGAN
jgi:tetratricopeptide (TPR) repeat protein